MISIACMIGTPAEYSAANVRDQRARAIFWTVTPILNGILQADAVPLRAAP